MSERIETATSLMCLSCEDRIPGRDRGDRALAHRIDAHARRKQARSQPEGADTDLAVVGKILVRDAADRADDRGLRQHRHDRRNALGAERARRKEFQRRRAERKRQKGFGRREHAGHGDHAVFLRALHDGAVDVGADQQAAAGLVQIVDIFGVSTVPAPTSAEAGRVLARRSIEVNGSGEFSGTSIASMPASKTAEPMASASSGLRPRRMATRLRRSFGNGVVMRRPFPPSRGAWRPRTSRRGRLRRRRPGAPSSRQASAPHCRASRAGRRRRG